jgi:hypothetical protein
MANTVDSFIPFFGRDFLTATMGWTAEERGHYVTLLIIQWEQGSIPVTPDRVELVSAGVTACWATLEPKFPIGPDGLRRNLRMEEHRARATDLRKRRSEAGSKGNAARWGEAGSQRDRKGIANAIAKTSHPSPSPSPQEEKNYRSSHAEDKKATHLVFPCDRGEWVPTAEMLEEWRSTFPTLDIDAQLRLSRQWCLDNPERRKTPRGMRRFIGKWLANAQTAPKPVKPSTKVLATL